MKVISVHNLNEASAQEVFDFVATSLMKQGRHSRTCEDGVCLYRGPEGTKCAAGFLIPDDLYSHTMERRGWGKLAEAWGFSKKHKELIQRLQTLHDVSPVCYWPAKLADVARLEKLNTDAIKRYL